MNHISGKIYKTILIGIFLFIGINGCKDNYNSVIPWSRVDIDINPINDIDLNIPGGSHYFPNQGYGGVIIFRDLTDSSNPFLAFDATCTHEISPTCRVVPDGSGLAKCECCGSQFILFGGNGSATSGPAVEPLRQYKVSYIGGRIVVRN